MSTSTCDCDAAFNVTTTYPSGPGTIAVKPSELTLTTGSNSFTTRTTSAYNTGYSTAFNETFAVTQTYTGSTTPLNVSRPTLAFPTGAASFTILTQNAYDKGYLDGNTLTVGGGIAFNNWTLAPTHLTSTLTAKYAQQNSTITGTVGTVTNDGFLLTFTPKYNTMFFWVNVFLQTAPGNTVTTGISALVDVSLSSVAGSPNPITAPLLTGLAYNQNNYWILPLSISSTNNKDYTASLLIKIVFANASLNNSATLRVCPELSSASGTTTGGSSSIGQIFVTELPKNLPY